MGVAAFVAILATVNHADPVPAFRSGHWLTVGLLAAAGLPVLTTFTTLRLTRSAAVPAAPAAAPDLQGLQKIDERGPDKSAAR